MARSRGDQRGRRWDLREYWSGRCRKADGITWGDRYAKRATHRHERRQNKAACSEEA